MALCKCSRTVQGNLTFVIKLIEKDRVMISLRGLGIAWVTIADVIDSRARVYDIWASVGFLREDFGMEN